MSEKDAGEENGVGDQGSKPEPTTVTPGTGHVRLSPLGFHLRARDFFDIAELARARAERFSPVAAFLYARSIELALKSYLLARGDSVDRVAAFGHDLALLLTESFARGLDAVVPLTSEDKRTLLATNNHYLTNQLAYFDLFATVSGYPGQPDLASIARVARALLDGVERGCYEAADGGWRPW
jgi:hypothetical protein